MKKLLLIILSLLCLPLVSGAIFTATMQTPTTGARKTGTQAVFNVTIGNDYGGESISNVTCAFFIRATDTANSTYILMANVSNSTGGGGINVSLTGVNITYDITQVEDSSLGQAYATCYNMSGGTADGVDSAVITFVIDSTIPNIPTSLSPTTADNNSLTFSGTVGGANTTGCTLHFSDRNPGERSYSMTHSGNSCYKSISSVPEQHYDFYITATDGLNSTSSSPATLIIDIEYSGRRAKGQEMLRTGEISLEEYESIVGGKISHEEYLSIVGGETPTQKSVPTTKKTLTFGTVTTSPITWIIVVIMVLGGLFIYSKKHQM